jgi:hypothetical protein
VETLTAIADKSPADLRESILESSVYRESKDSLV